ncbi:adenosylmethionine--8-amino-7-oxononanoate transaminase [Streptomyces sp. NBC_01565]|uniref:adenosylmethionine--8-amino-7-oxononanoate transaminase n=1 Tax=unclassified Streptomyces TaxID=2593676 RepID=UPI002255A7F3|nr:adenosylmethionine--8-amino-7-oxononanoate transaminase [Streptomyces sp. NBC_01565]MCX4547069.1 adenosylmethionine--8-amino-7-oxononanoate transaminase [Streptomyces sp. NBC_01565]
MSVENLIDRDMRHVWHPYAPMPATERPLVVDSAQGVRLRLAAPYGGTDEVIDGMSSWWAAVHGYRNPVLDDAVRRQLDKMSHVMFGGLTHEPAVNLVTKLVEITPDPLQHVFLCDSGSVSVEVAVKMCLQYWRSTGKPDKTKLATWRGGYHGDTFTPMGVCDPEGGMHRMWSGVLKPQVFMDRPPAGFEAGIDDRYAHHLADVIERNADELAAVIVEPVCQGTGGMRFHDPVYLQVLREVTRANDVLLIFDEIATGFGRTGAMFATDHAGVSPDVMCVGKALTGGYLSMAATLCTSEIADGIGRGAFPALAHGPTFMGNPLASAVACASIDLLYSQDWRSNVSRIETALTKALAPAKDLPAVKDVRVLGAIGVVQLDHQVDIGLATDTVLRNGVWLRPFRDMIYTMPPYISTDEDLAAIGSAMTAAARIA